MTEREKCAGGCVLVVEDSKSFSRMLKTRIEDELGLRVLAVMSEAECRLAVAGHRAEIAVAVLDLHLPDSPNGEVVDFVVGEGIPVIVLTGDYSETIRKRILRKKVVDYFIKDSGVVIDFLLATLRRFFANQGVEVLVVDDSPTFRNYVGELLTRRNFTVLMAGSAAEARAVRAGRPDMRMAIVDLSLPDMDGDALIREWRSAKENETLALIGISGAGKPDVTARFLKSGANDFLSKPFSEEEFHLRVTQNIGMFEHLAKLRDLNEVKNRFIGMAAHDLRNPISSVIGLGQIVAEGVVGPLNNAQKTMLERILGAARHMLGLVNDILDVSAIESGRVDLYPAETNLADLAREAADFNAQAAAAKDIGIELSLEDVRVVCDRDKIMQVIDNLLSNAVKYSARNSRVIVRVGPQERGAVIEVHDSGPGLSEDDRRRLFGAFERLSAKPTGGEKSVGLGLAIAKRIIEAHRGGIDAENRPEGGAIFRVSLPGACPTA